MLFSVPSFTHTPLPKFIRLFAPAPKVDHARTYNIDFDNLQTAIERVKGEGRLRPAALMTVDLFGQPVDYGRAREIADRHGLALHLRRGTELRRYLRGSPRWSGPTPTSPPLASFRPNRWGATVTAVQCSPMMTNLPTLSVRYACMVAPRNTTWPGWNEQPLWTPAGLRFSCQSWPLLLMSSRGGTRSHAPMLIGSRAMSTHPCYPKVILVCVAQFTIKVVERDEVRPG